MSNRGEEDPGQRENEALLLSESPSLVFSEEVVRVSWTDSQEPEFEKRRIELRVFGLDLATLDRDEDSEDVDDDAFNSNRSLLLKLAEAMGSGAVASGVHHILNRL